MRRPAALVLTFALITSALVAGAFSGASAFIPVGIAHPGGDDGNFYTIPATYEVGDAIELYANFASDQSGRTVTYYRESPAGSDGYTSVGTDAANSNGNAYLKNYTVNGTQKVFARSSSGDVTEVHTLTPTVPGPVEHPGGDDGNLYTIPETFEVGDEIELYANFASDQSGRTVTYFKETAAGSDEYEKVGTDDANRNGNAYLKNYTVNESQKVFARSSTGKVTEVQTLTPTVPGPVSPNGTVTGTLAPTPAAFGDGDTIQLGANFPSGVFPVEFYGEGPADVWTKLATIQSNTHGNAYFKTYEVEGTQQVFARRTNNDRTQVFTVTPSAKTTLSIQRNCDENSCTGTATASGVLDPATAGVSVRLQRLSGSSWTNVGSAVDTDAAGKVAIQFSLSGVPQWTTRTYRMLSNGVASNEIQFMPGPTQLGKNVLRVDVEDGIYPTEKGPEYPGVATLSTNGDVLLDHVELEDFGVRGSTTATYTKKPYKLKFDKSPKDTGVFGMPADKSWTLLAMWKDQAFIREKVGLDLGIKMDHIYWTPDSRFVEMFVNDQYRGAYLMTESVKIDGDRVDVDAEHGVIMETDEPSVEDPDLGFESTIGNIVFAFKDPDDRDETDPEKVTQSKFDAIRNRINEFESKLYSSSTRDEYPDFIDVDSAIDFFFVKEFTKDHDSDFDRSHYFSWDPIVPEGVGESPGPMEDNRFHFGPGWDFDHSAGNDTDNDTFGAYLRSPAGWMLRNEGPTRSSHWFVELFEDPGFEAAVKQRWTEVRGIFEDVHQQDVDAYDAEIGVGASNDRNRWASEPKRFSPHGSGLAGERAYVKNWYEDRFSWMDGELS